MLAGICCWTAIALPAWMVTEWLIEWGPAEKLIHLVPELCRVVLKARWHLPQQLQAGLAKNL